MNQLSKFSVSACALAVMALVAFTGVATAGPIGDVSAGEMAGYSQIYDLDIAAGVSYAGGVPYSVNNSGTAIPGGISRIAYYMELTTAAGREWVWVSAEAFTQDLTKIGVPNLTAGFTWQQLLTSMNVESNDSSIVTGTGITTGNIEFWPYNYGTANVAGIPLASNSTYDFGDESAGGSSYGSMQIHNHGAGAQQTLFALNRFHTGGAPDIGIGNQAGGNPDWTFAANAGSYSARNLQVWVRPTNFTAATVPLPGAAWTGLALLGGLGLVRRVRRRIG